MLNVTATAAQASHRVLLKLVVAATTAHIRTDSVRKVSPPTWVKAEYIFRFRLSILDGEVTLNLSVTLILLIRTIRLSTKTESHDWKKKKVDITSISMLTPAKAYKKMISTSSPSSEGSIMA
jgi:hypothetical protein